MYLNDPRVNDFEAGRSDVFTLTLPELGDLTKVRIRHDNAGKKAGWFLEEIRVVNLNTGKAWVFPWHGWLAKDEGDGLIDRQLPVATTGQVSYQVTVKTGTVSGAGTDANVYITLYGSKGAGVERLLDTAGRNDFENGSSDVFTLGSPDLGNLTKVRIRHDNSGRKAGWFLEDITVQNMTTYQAWKFPWNKWLATDEGDGRIDTEINAFAIVPPECFLEDTPAHGHRWRCS